MRHSKPLGDGTAYEPEEVARGGLFAILGADGVARVERGLIRPEDVPSPEPESEPEAETGEHSVATGEETDGEAEEPEEEQGAPLSERLVLDLTSHRTMALRDALGASPTVALSAVVHSLALGAFLLALRPGILPGDQGKLRLSRWPRAGHRRHPRRAQHRRTP